MTYILLYKRDVCLFQKKKRCLSVMQQSVYFLFLVDNLFFSIYLGRPIATFSVVWLGRKLFSTRPTCGSQTEGYLRHNKMIFLNFPSKFRVLNVNSTFRKKNPKYKPSFKISVKGSKTPMFFAKVQLTPFF